MLKTTFDLMGKGDICVYADAGCTIESKNKNTLLEYLEMLESSKATVSFQYSPEFKPHGKTKLEYIWTTERVFEHFSVDDSIRNTFQFWAGCLFFRKTTQTTELINTCYEMAMNQPTLFTEIHNDYKRHPDFFFHSVIPTLRFLSGEQEYDVRCIIRNEIIRISYWLVGIVNYEYIGNRYTLWLMA